LAYRTTNKVKAVLKVKSHKSSDAEETFVVVDELVSEIYSGISNP
jgi:hypothetical protein